MPRWRPLTLLLMGVLAGGGSPRPAHAEEQPSPAESVPSYETDVRPLLLAKCGMCHGPTTQKADLALHTPEAIQKGSESGPVLTPGKLEESLLYEMIHQGQMPPEGQEPLAESDVDLIRRWIVGGAPFDSPSPVAQSEVTQHDILPILLLRCTVCHGRHKQEGGLDLRSRAAMLRGGKSGPAFVPGKPEESLILRRIETEEMPPRPRLIEVTVKPMEPEEIKTLTRWIAMGAPEVADEPDLAGGPQDPLVSAVDREFWSFQPPRAVAIPVVKRTAAAPDRSAPENPIDAFVLEKLSEQGLSLSPETDRATLLRRVTFDLTGLPPEPSEIEAFIADDSPDAYEKVVDRLLASPRYGERLARDWLDLAGYADCEGRREQHLPRPFAWRYRDYVIRAFNNDKPYDRFLQEQLAGDELADYEHAPEITQELEDNLVATGFLRMSPDPTWANLTGFVPDRLEVMVDAIDVLGSGVMGLTMKCCRCHSHKFDPLPQRDYYRLVAIFKGAFDEHDWLKPEINNFGGAVSAGIGERYLPYVASEERRNWQSHNARLDSQIEALKAAAQTADTEKEIQALAAQRLPEPRIMALWDRGEPSPTYIYRRGDYQNAGAPVHPGVPAVLADGQTPFRIDAPWPGAKSTGRRLAFARWLTQADHPLTARVAVNRMWRFHFGQGLVRSVGNFGHTGDRPTHPELLDWLARQFVQSGWSFKAMHRLMVTSQTYRQRSAVTAEHEQRDPRNLLLSRMPLHRLEAEALRDTLLHVAGSLDETRFGPADPVQVQPDGLVLAGRRRSIYVQQLRKHPVSLLESFDLPAMNPNCLQRTDSVVAPQALHLLNDTTVRELAGKFADRVQREAGPDPTLQVTRAYWIAIGRAPAAEELKSCEESLARLTEQWIRQLGAIPGPANPEAARRALTTVCHAILNSAAFLYID